MKWRYLQCEDMRESPKHRVEEHESLRKVMEGKLKLKSKSAKGNSHDGSATQAA